MNTEFNITEFKEKFSSEILEILIRNQRRIIMSVNPDALLNNCDLFIQN